jgi:hypothetical protein
MYRQYENNIIDWLFGDNAGFIPIGCLIILIALIIVLK